MNNWKEKLIDLIESEKIRSDSNLENFADDNRV